MGSTAVGFLLLFLIASVSSRSFQCPEGCKCEVAEPDNIINCDSAGLERFPLPHSTPVKGFHYLAMPCNDIEELPSAAMIKASFPDVRGIDVEGNPRISCDDVEALSKEIPIVSDCGKDKKDLLQCDNFDKNCDWKCRALTRLQEMWAQFKDLVSRKAKEWQAEETIQAARNWFSAQFKKFKVAIGDLTD